MTPGGRLAGIDVVIAEDEADLRLGMWRLLAGQGATVRVAVDGAEALQALGQRPADLVLTDLMMPRMSGADLLLEVRARFPATGVVIFTGFGTIQTAVTCLHNGAAHFLTKPFDNDEVVQIVERLGRQAAAARTPERAAGGVTLVAEDPAMRAALALAERAARSPVPVLIEGESGTGKELVARFVHEHSAVRDQPFLAVNAAALPDTLLESELFGHRKGAFTGADKDRAGLFVEARGGTVFLDEIASMSAAFQGKLLRVLQEKVVRPLGGTGDVPVEFRLVSATNRDLTAMIQRGEFREDLFYRLGVVRVHLPPLRERPGDIVPLASELLARAARICLAASVTPPAFSVAALAALRAHPWPGNVREMWNAIQRALVVCGGGEILPHHLGLEERPWQGPAAGAAPVGDQDYGAEKQRAIERFQREYIQRALERTGGNISHAAERCGMTRAALQRIMRQLGLGATPE